MTELLIRELKEVGLHLNAQKTKILHSCFADQDSEKDFVEIDNDFVGILHPGSHHRYLGRLLSLCPDTRIKLELDNRKKQAWMAFHKNAKIILNKNVSVEKRLKYFDSCVTPSILFSLSSFPVSKYHLQLIHIAYGPGD